MTTAKLVNTPGPREQSSQHHRRRAQLLSNCPFLSRYNVKSIALKGCCTSERVRGWVAKELGSERKRRKGWDVR
jgi:hypothetical protein